MCSNDTVVAILKVSPGNALCSLIWQDYQTQEEAAVAAAAGAERKKASREDGTRYGV